MDSREVSNSHGRGKCLDTLDDAEQAAREGLKIIQEYSKSNSKDKAILDLVQRYFDDYRTKIKAYRKECLELDHEGPEGNLELQIHIASVNKYIKAPIDLSRIVLLLQTWKQQLLDTNLRNDSKFGERLVADVFKDLGIDAIPVVLFADRFSAFDAGAVFFVTIPYVLHRTYKRWWGISHEIGHAYFARTEDELDRNALISEIDSLMREDIPHIIEEKELESGAAILLWAHRWLGELLSDYVALSLFGFNYLLEMRQSHDEMVISLGSMSHPPLDFRINCLRWALKTNGIDLRELEEYFEYSSSIHKEMNPILNTLTSTKMAERFSVWMFKQPPYQRIGNNWTEILELGKHEMPSDVSLATLFATLSVESITEDVEDLFQALKMRILTDDE